MKGIHRIGLAALLFAANLSQSSSSSPTPNLRTPSRTIRKLEYENRGVKTVGLTIREEMEFDSRKERRLSGPLGGGGGGGGSSSSSGGGSTGGGSSGSSSSSSGSSNASSETSGRSATTTTTSAASSENLSSGGSFNSPDSQGKNTNFGGTKRLSVSVKVSLLGAFMCLFLLLAMLAVGSHQVFSRENKGQGGEGILCGDNSKAEHLMNASLA